MRTLSFRKQRKKVRVAKGVCQVAVGIVNVEQMHGKQSTGTKSAWTNVIGGVLRAHQAIYE
jgi:hypothetical protein